MKATIPASPEEALSQWSAQMSDTVQDWWDSTTRVWEPVWRAWVDPVASALGSEVPTLRRPRGRCGCGCEDERQTRADRCCDPCACCVPEADVVLHTRAGERRMVPFDVANERHRERQVTLSVGEWVRCDGPEIAVKAALVPSGELTLAACEHRLVRLAVQVSSESTGSAEKGGDRLPDIEACASGYVEVRFEGCARPVRVAVVVHPDRCDAVAVDCGCGCGCR